MWSVISTQPFCALSLRRITLFFSAILMALFALLATYTPNVNAQAAGAVWIDANTISYNSQTYTKEQDGAAALYDGMPDGATTYLYTDQSVNPPLSKVLYFEKGTTITEAKNVKYAEYNLPQSGGNKLVRKGAAQDIAITPDANSAGADDAAADGTGEKVQTSSCDNKYVDGIAWLICPITNAIAKGMDWLYTSVITQFLLVPPVTTNRDSPLYRAWDMTRNIANVMFVIGFLIIIYSQTTSLGLSSYGIKRLLPRLVIAAILVNVSYWITALAVDASNIIGVGIHEALTSIRQNIAVVGSAKTPDYSWEAIATFILSGGGVALVAGFAIHGILAQTVGAAIWMLLPILMGVLLSALVAILVMAARQALITILIILSPLAFVAYLLPNTEKYFQRWRELFMTMLLVFPIFSVVFSGSQLAGSAIIQSVSPDSVGSITIIILGMAAQVMPLVITPFLIKISGSLLGRIAGMVNNPNRGLIDQSRNFAKDRAERKKAQTLGGMDENGNRLRDRKLRGLGGRIAQSMENKKRGNEGLKKAHEEGIEAGYLESDRYKNIVHPQHEMATRYKTIGEEESKKHFQNHMEHSTRVREIDTMARIATEEAKMSTERNDTEYKNLQTDPTNKNLEGVENTALRALAVRAKQVSDDARDVKYRQSVVDKRQESDYHINLSDPANEARLNYAGNKDIDEHGPQRVINVALDLESKTFQEKIRTAIATANNVEAPVDDRILISVGDTPTSENSAKIVSFKDDPYSRAAMAADVVEHGSRAKSQILLESHNLTSSATGDEKLIRTMVADALRKNGHMFIGQGTISMIAEGTLDTSYQHGDFTDKLILGYLNEGGLSADAMVNGDKDDLIRIDQFLESHRGELTAGGRAQLIESLNTAFSNPLYAGKMAKRKTWLNDMRAKMDLERIGGDDGEDGE